jgi:hypothetical protein
LSVENCSGDPEVRGQPNNSDHDVVDTTAGHSPAALAHTMAVLLGLIRGVLADGVLNEKEILALNAWLGNHGKLLTHWPANAIAERIQAVLADGIITPDESKNLAETLTRILGCDSTSWSTLDPLPAAETPRPAQPIVIPGRSFMLAGNFLYGTHSRCQDAILRRGGLTDKIVGPSLDYLVVGALPPSESTGSELPVVLKQVRGLIQQGCDITIVPEQTWHCALGES